MAVQSVSTQLFGPYNRLHTAPASCSSPHCILSQHIPRASLSNVFSSRIHILFSNIRCRNSTDFQKVCGCFTENGIIYNCNEADFRQSPCTVASPLHQWAIWVAESWREYPQTMHSSFAKAAYRHSDPPVSVLVSARIHVFQRESCMGCTHN